MGGGKPPSQIGPRNTDDEADAPEEIAKLMMPMYYIENAIVSESDIAHAKLAWKLISFGNFPAYQELKSTTESKLPGLEFFSAQFYDRFFSINPCARSLYSNIEMQGRVLVAIISTALSQLKDPVGFNLTLAQIAHVHSARGIKCPEFGIMGDVLFWTMKNLLGPSFTEDSRIAWVKIYSRMLQVIIPLIIADEMKKRRKKIILGKCINFIPYDFNLLTI